MKKYYVEGTITNHNENNTQVDFEFSHMRYLLQKRDM